MIFVYIILFVIFLLITLYILALRPNTSRGNQMLPFESNYIAHRGLFNNKDIPENSLSAFSSAIKAGYGIELDVQLTTDNHLVVFHDSNLDRMCGINKTLYECSLEELTPYKLLNTNEGIPLLKDVLTLVNGKVPLIIEIKSDGRYIDTSIEVAKLLSNYSGIYCIESFHPFVITWFKKNYPEILRGQLSTNYKKDNIDRSFIERFLLTNLLFNFLSKPDFIAYNHIYSNQFSYMLCKKLYKVRSAAWTIKSQEELNVSRKSFEAFIFDSFIPEQANKNL